jgi:hypothetical protein
MKIRKYLIKDDAGKFEEDRVWMTEIILFSNNDSIKNKLEKWANEVRAAFIKNYLPNKIVIEDKYVDEIMQTFQNDIDGTGKSRFYFRDPVNGKLYKEKIIKTKSYKDLNESGTVVGGSYWGSETPEGNDSGSRGPAAAEDNPPGHGYLGHRYRRGDYYNRLTNFQTIWKVDDQEKFDWSYFPLAKGQEDWSNFSTTIEGLGKLFPEETWNNVVKKMTNVPKKVRSKRFDVLKKQPYRTSYDTLSKSPEDQQGGTKIAEVPKELEVKESFNLINNINKLLIDGYKKKKVNESKVSDTILKQIKSIDKWALDSYGAKNFVSSDKSIQFDVKGSKFRGRVIITYDRGSDSYIIELGKLSGVNWKQKYMMKNVFAKDLVNVLDQQIG